jgi:TonB family protein
MSGGGQPGLTFDEAERHASLGTFIPSFSQSSAGGGAATWSAGQATFQLARPDARAASLSAAKPRLIHRVEPRWPAEATASGAQGLVLIELAVGLDGAVRDARVLRSVPLLDAAALAATRQWRYEPAGPEGRPDPMVVTVAFSLPVRRW